MNKHSKYNLKVNLFQFYFKLVVALIWIKLIFSYLSVKLVYFQKHLTSNFEDYNPFGLPEDFSKNIEFLLLPLLLYGVFKYFKHIDAPLKSIVYMSLMMYALNIITGMLNTISVLDSLNYSLKLFTPIYFFCVLVIYNNKTQNSIKPYLEKIIKLCLILSVIGLLLFNPSFNRLESRLPIYFDGIHTHTYVLVSIFIGIGYLLYRAKKYHTLLLFLVLSFTFLYFGYSVRTSLLMYLLYIMTMLFLISDIFKVLFIKVLVFIPFVAMFFFLLQSEAEMTELSSGRTDMYAEKLKQLSTYNFTEWLFGKGYEADLIVIDTWWWDAKGAHSDLFTFLIENGILYLLMFLILMIRMMLFLTPKPNVIIIAIISGILLTSTISNGFAIRPIASYIIYMVLAYIYIDVKERSSNIG